jgi:hypothetical protein
MYPNILLKITEKYTLRGLQHCILGYGATLNICPMPGIKMD